MIKYVLTPWMVTNLVRGMSMFGFYRAYVRQRDGEGMRIERTEESGTGGQLC